MAKGLHLVQDGPRRSSSRLVDTRGTTVRRARLGLGRLHAGPLGGEDGAVPIILGDTEIARHRPRLHVPQQDQRLAPVRGADGGLEEGAREGRVWDGELASRVGVAGDAVGVSLPSSAGKGAEREPPLARRGLAARRFLDGGEDVDGEVTVGAAARDVEHLPAVAQRKLFANRFSRRLQRLPLSGHVARNHGRLVPPLELARRVEGLAHRLDVGVSAAALRRIGRLPRRSERVGRRLRHVAFEQQRPFHVGPAVVPGVFRGGRVSDRPRRSAERRGRFGSANVPSVVVVVEPRCRRVPARRRRAVEERGFVEEPGAVERRQKVGVVIHGPRLRRARSRGARRAVVEAAAAGPARRHRCRRARRRLGRRRLGKRRLRRSGDGRIVEKRALEEGVVRV
mmetsp:Transcript_2673/g.9462  ORF Transcript_2673/g.9462 Transcript_2673/m.9462 type:complete len:396 (-) Transcript_2673:249-1436(-)